MALLVLDSALHREVGHQSCDTTCGLAVVLVERPACQLNDLCFTLDSQRVLQRSSLLGLIVLRRPFRLVLDDCCPENPL